MRPRLRIERERSARSRGWIVREMLSINWCMYAAYIYALIKCKTFVTFASRRVCKRGRKEKENREDDARFESASRCQSDRNCLVPGVNLIPELDPLSIESPSHPTARYEVTDSLCYSFSPFLRSLYIRDISEIVERATDRFRSYGRQSSVNRGEIGSAYIKIICMRPVCAGACNIN